MPRMPDFTTEDHQLLLSSLRDVGYRILPASRLADRLFPTVYLRHDIDLSPVLCLPIARSEAAASIAATYYVLLSAHYNPASRTNEDALRELVSLGHNIGLHYDVLRYPDDSAAAERRLLEECDRLALITGSSVTTVSLHQPSLSGRDPFLTSDTMVHPHDPRLTRDVPYISDSCRAFRDESLLEFLLPGAPERMPYLQLLTHPEVWIGPGAMDRLTFLERVLTPAALSDSRSYFDDEVRAIWSAHSGAAAHDARVGLHRRFITADRHWTALNLDALRAMYDESPELRWGARELTLDLPRKWEFSVAALSGAQIAGASMNSEREGELYVHSFLVREGHRGTGLADELLDAVVDRAKAHDLRGIQLRVAQGNGHALKFYLRRGFQIRRLEPDLNQLVLGMPL